MPEARFREDLKADSLDLVELIMAFEEAFGGEIKDEDAQKITTVGEAVSTWKGPAPDRRPDLSLGRGDRAKAHTQCVGLLLGDR